MKTMRLGADNFASGGGFCQSDDTLPMLDLLNAEEIALIWQTDPHWRLPGGCSQRNKRHAEAVDLVVHIADSQTIGMESRNVSALKTAG